VVPPAVFILVLSFLLFFRLPVVHSEDVHLSATATTPTRTEEPVGESSGSVSVEVKEDLDSQNPVVAPEVLRDLPGVRVEESGTMGESASLSLRGADPAQTLILLNGIRLNSPYRGNTDIGNFLMDNLDQIEVVRGAQSALYGSDAMGGVVNLRTGKPALPLEGSVWFEAGSEKTFREGAGVGGKREWGDFLLNASRTDSGGQFKHDDFGATTLSGDLGVLLPGGGRLNYTPRFQWDHKNLALDVLDPGVSVACQTAPIPDPTNCVEVSFDKNRKIDRRQAVNILKYGVRPLPWWNLTLTGAENRERFEEDNPEESGALIPWAYFEDTHSTERTVNLQQDVEWYPKQVLSVGVEYLADRVVNDYTVPLAGPIDEVDNRRANAAFYAQQLVKWEDRFVLQGGVRVDRNSQFGRVVNPKVSSAYEIEATQTRIRGSWGTGFHAPTFRDLYHPFFGNPDLDPEESRSWEVGVTQPLLRKKIRLDAAFFRTDYHNLIQINPTGVENIGRARAQGVESTVSIFPLPYFWIDANHTYLSAEDRETDARLPFRPRNLANVRLHFTPRANLILVLDVNLVGDQALSTVFIKPDGTVLRDRSPGYTRLDLSANYLLFGILPGVRETKFFVTVKNLLDRDYEEVPGFPAPGVTVLAGFSSSL
jgi:vitamin B12 transporter